MRTYGRKYPLSPYLRSLAIMLLISMGIGICLMIYFALEEGCRLSFVDAISTPTAVTCYFMVIAYGAVLGVFLWNSFEYFGTMEITPYGLEFSAIFHDKIVFLYADIFDIGIDYGQLPLGKQFWIYFSKEKIEHRYCHRVNRIPFSRSTMRIQYQDDVYEGLLNGITDTKLQKKLHAASSTLRVNGMR